MRQNLSFLRHDLSFEPTGRDNTMAQQRQFTGQLRDTNLSFLPPVDGEQRPINVLLILLDNFSLISFTSVIDSLVTANLVTSTKNFSFFTCGINKSSVMSDVGISITVDVTLRPDILKQAEIIIVCGGYRSPLNEIPLLSRALRAVNDKKQRLGGLWNGALALCHAGILSSQTFALHPDNHAYAREHFPHINLASQTYVIDGHFFSSSGPTSSLEMMLNLIQLMLGEACANAVREILSCDRDKVSDHSTTFNDPLPLQAPELLKKAVHLMQHQLDEPLPIETVANQVGTSRRTLERLFKRYLNTSPSRHYLEIRLTCARQLLTQSNQTISQIAVATGFISANYFSQCFKEYFSVSPTQIRSPYPNDEQCL